MLHYDPVKWAITTSSSDAIKINYLVRCGVCLCVRGSFSHDVNMDDKKSYNGNGKDHSIQ